MEPTLWYQNAIFYQVYVRAFYDSNSDGHGDIRGLTQKLDYLQDLGVDCLWLMPIYPSPLKDDGYDIADYYNIAEIFGGLDDLKELIGAAHARNIHIIMDLVLNHTSDRHAWFQSARADRASPFRNYYVWSDTDKKYVDARIIFRDTETSNWTWDEKAGQYFWHRFYSSQPDLNFDHPSVQAEILNVMKFWLDLGIDGFRADAVPYLFERDGTTCENLPETHAFLKKMRRFVDDQYPDRILLCEANQWPAEVRDYFGDGDEFHMAFHFPLMPRIFMSIRKGESEPIRWAMDQTPPIPENCQWGTFLRNHDELTLEMVTPEEREWMWQQYAPQPRMRQNLGIRRRLSPLLDNDLRKIRLANSLLFTLPGSPILYYGDEIGMGDNLDLPDRNGVRTPMQWDNSANGGFTAGKPYMEMVKGESDYHHINVALQVSDADSLLHSISNMIKVRKARPAFGHGSMKWVETGNPAVAAYTREYAGETLLIFNNLSSSSQTISLPPEYCIGYVDLLTGSEQTITSSLILEAHGYLWLRKE